MALETKFQEMTLDDVLNVAHQKKQDGWRCVQVLCTNTDDGIDMTYTYWKGELYDNYQVRGVKKGTPVPSIQGMFLGVFPFENEAHDLFGVDVQGMALDFGGQFYQVSTKEPMTVISPAQKEAREKAAKLAKAKEAAAAKKAAQAEADDKGKDGEE